METVKRINLARVREMFDEVGVMPTKFDPHACVMGLYRDHYKEEYNKFDMPYVYGVMDGFDDAQKGKLHGMDSIKYNLGYADGAAARKILGV